MQPAWDKKNFGAVDFVVFTGLLLISSGIGILFAYKDRKRTSMKNYYFGNMTMHPIVVGMSLAVGGISALTMIGVPIEVYIVGTAFIWALPAVFLVVILTMVYYIPIYRRLQLNTLFEYLELRFNANTRRLCSMMVTFSMIFYMGVAVYLPSLSLSAVAPISLHWSIALTSVICTFYTTVGGIKAVIWTDVLQAAMMVIGMFAIFYRGLTEIGGFGELHASLERGERLNFLRLDNFHISSRTSPMAITTGVIWIYLYLVPFSQSAVQRFRACKSTRQAQYSMVVFLLPALSIIFLAIGSGFVLYAYFEGCDPVRSGKISRLDQGIPYMALQLFHDMPGMAGMIVAAIYSGSLSTVSSGVNSFSMVLLQDFIVAKWPELSERRKLLIGKIIAVVIGMLVMAVAYGVTASESNIIKTFGTLNGAILGPVMGMFILGLFFPWTNSVGSIVGPVLGLGVMVWIVIGSMFFKTIPSLTVSPPMSSNMCPAHNITLALMPVMNATPATSLENNSTIITLAEMDSGYSIDQLIYSINFQYYKFLGMATTIVFGLIASLLSGPNRPSKANPDLFIPLVDNKLLPKVIRKCFRFGVPEIKVSQRVISKGQKLLLRSPA